MSEETLIYYSKKISMLGLSERTKEELKSNFKKYYRYFKKKEGYSDLEYMIGDTFSLKRNEAKYVYILCKVHYLKDIHHLPPRETQLSAGASTGKRIIKFNNINEWAEDRARRGIKFKEPEFYKCLVQNYYRYRQKDLIKLLEKEFKLKVPAGYTKIMWEDYLSKVKVKEA